MDNELVSDDLWQTLQPLLQPLLPPERRTPRSRGRPRIPARAVLCGIVYVLKTGIPWKRLPKELGYGSGVTCWRRLKEWQRAGVFSLLLRRLLDSLGTRGLIDWSRACVDSATVPAKKGASWSALIPPIEASLAPSATCSPTRRPPARGASYRCQRPRLQGVRGVA